MAMCFAFRRGGRSPDIQVMDLGELPRSPFSFIRVVPRRAVVALARIGGMAERSDPNSSVSPRCGQHYGDVLANGASVSCGALFGPSVPQSLHHPLNCGAIPSCAASPLIWTLRCNPPGPRLRRSPGLIHFCSLRPIHAKVRFPGRDHRRYHLRRRRAKWVSIIRARGAPQGCLSGTCRPATPERRNLHQPTVVAGSLLASKVGSFLASAEAPGVFPTIWHCFVR